MPRTHLFFSFLMLILPALPAWALVPELQLRPYDHMGNNPDLYGRDVSISGDYLAVGSPDDQDATGGRRGSVYIYKRQGGTWVLDKHLKASDQQEHSRYGWSVALKGNTLMVGAPDWFGAVFQQGRIYIYEHINGDWVEQATVTQPGPSPEQSLGVSIAFDDERIVGGGMGGTWTFRKIAGVWTFESKHGFQGWDVALEGNLFSTSPFGGGCWIFEFSNGIWAPVFSMGGRIGMAIQDGVVYIADSSFNMARRNEQGSWVIESVNSPDSFIGTAISVRGKKVLVADKTRAIGIARLYIKHPVNGWVMERQYQQGTATPERFGESASLIDTSLAVGATFLGDGSGGSVYVAEIPFSKSPTSLTLTASSDSGLSNSDGITNLDNPLVFEVGGTVSGATVTLYDADANVVLGSVVATGSTTNVVLDSGIVLLDGDYRIYVRQTEATKIESPLEDAPQTTFTVDTVAPLVPQSPLLSVTSDSGVPSDNLTNVREPIFIVDAAGSYLRLFGDGVQIGEPFLVGSDLQLPEQSEGAHVYTLKAVDDAGNLSVDSASLEVIFDFTPPVPFLIVPTGVPLFTQEMTLLTGFFNSSVVGLADTDFEMFNATAMGFSQAGDDDFNMLVTPTAPGTVQVQLPPGTLTDLAGNPNIAGEVSFIAVARSTELSWNPASITYGTPLSAAQLNAIETSDIPGTFTYSPPAGTVLSAGKRTLNVTFTPNDPLKYAASQLSVLISVSSAPMTIRANDVLKVAGTPIAPFTASYTGFVNGESEAALTTPVKFSTSATELSHAGTYPISVSGAFSANYSITFKPGVLTVTNSQPQLLSPFSAAPNPCRNKQLVTFTVAASDLDSHALSYNWDFGDGVTSSGAQTLHSYAFASVYTVTSTITDGFGGVNVSSANITVLDGDGARSPNGDWDDDGISNSDDPDDDNDGFSDELELAMGTSSTERLLTPLAADPKLMPSLTIQKLRVKLFFAKQNADSIDFTGIMPLSSVAGKNLIIDVGGVVRMFEVSAKGKSAATNSTLVARAKKIRSAGVQTTLTLKIKRATLTNFFVDEGLTGITAKGETALSIMILVENQGFQEVQSQQFKAKAGISVMTKEK